MVSIVIPYAFFFYESDVDPNQPRSGDRCTCESQAGIAACYTSVVFFIFLALLVILYAVLGVTHIPVDVITYKVSRVVQIGAAVPDCTPDLCVNGATVWEFPTSFPIFLIAFLSFIGWFFFTFFVGVGLVALPMDLINEFRTRPRKLEPAKYSEEKRNLVKRATDLIAIGEALKQEIEDAPPSARRKLAKIQRKFEANYYFLKKDFVFLETSFKLRGGNSLWYVFQLILGCLGAVISLTWIIHIALFVLPPQPISPFLNDLFITFETLIPGFPLLGVCVFGTWSYYLLWCCVKGNFKLGVRFFLWKMYPMEINNTMMNCFLFNTWLILLCSVPCVQFCATAFPIYTRYTAADLMFGSQIRYLRFFNYFYDDNIFVIVMLIMSVLSLLYLLVFPADRGAAVDKELKKLARTKGEDL